MAITYTNCDNHIRPIDDAINGTIGSLREVLANSKLVGTEDLFGEMITEESAKAALKINLQHIARALAKAADSIN